MHTKVANILPYLSSPLLKWSPRECLQFRNPPVAPLFLWLTEKVVLRTTLVLYFTILYFSQCLKHMGGSWILLFCVSLCVCDQCWNCINFLAPFLMLRLTFAACTPGLSESISYPSYFKFVQGKISFSGIDLQCLFMGVVEIKYYFSLCLFLP